MTDKEKIKQLELVVSNFRERTIMLKAHFDELCVLNNELTAQLILMNKYFKLIEDD